jgi:hypothetical protein
MATNSIADPGCSSRIPDPDFFHPGSEFFSSRARNLIRLFIRILIFYPSRISDPGVKKAPDPRSRIRNTGHKIGFCSLMRILSGHELRYRFRIFTVPVRMLRNRHDFEEQYGVSKSALIILTFPDPSEYLFFSIRFQA